NDSPFLQTRNHTVEQFVSAIKRQFDVLYAEGVRSARVMAICLHPYLIGVPHRIGGLDGAPSSIAPPYGVWFATGSADGPAGLAAIGRHVLMEPIELRGRFYCRPRRPTVVICADGCDPAYIEAGLKAGVLPTLARWQKAGFYAVADAAMPTFTNPNNLSIVTGAPPSVHGISGNFALDRDSGAEIMMTDPEMVHGSTVLALMSPAGVPVAAVTAKDKLRRMLGHGVDGICFSSQAARAGCEALVGRPKPYMYSADLSLFVLDAGIRLVEQRRAELLYLSLSDYVQHGHAPDEPEALEFHRALDERLARLVERGCVVALTPAPGMHGKALPDGRPHVLFLEDILNAEFGAGAVRVICPITDPFVRHHGALGSFVRIYRKNGVTLATLAQTIRLLPGIDAVLTREEAASVW